MDFISLAPSSQSPQVEVDPDSVTQAVLNDIQTAHGDDIPSTQENPVNEECQNEEPGDSVVKPKRKTDKRKKKKVAKKVKKNAREAAVGEEIADVGSQAAADIDVQSGNVEERLLTQETSAQENVESQTFYSAGEGQSEDIDGNVVNSEKRGKKKRKIKEPKNLK